MRRLSAALAAAAIILLGTLGLSDARAERALTSQSDLLELFGGSVIAADGPAGRPLKLYLFNSGKAMLEAGGSPDDAGVWSLGDDAFCVQFEEVFQARETCFAVIYHNPGRVLLVQNASITIEAAVVGRAIELSVR